ncbi:unnamed protein product [Ilex paraguariensis]|uniref:Uncharacterized protein n=1 Tax=Ilex paraguariensis TaxID=185542 RepID=A0ABC8TRP8_9AQUA
MNEVEKLPSRKTNSKFLLWRAQRCKFIEQELEKVWEEISLHKKQSEPAEDAKMQVLKELECTKRVIQELKLNLDRVD